MPYKTTTDLSKTLQDILPKRAQSIYVETFNSAYDGYNPKEVKGSATREQYSHSVAWSAVKQEFHKGKNGSWVQNEGIHLITEGKIALEDKAKAWAANAANAIKTGGADIAVTALAGMVLTGITILMALLTAGAAVAIILRTIKMILELIGLMKARKEVFDPIARKKFIKSMEQYKKKKELQRELQKLEDEMNSME